MAKPLRAILAVFKFMGRIGFILRFVKRLVRRK